MKSPEKIKFNIPAIEMNAKFPASDYCRLYREDAVDVELGLCEIMGRRRAQEDELEYSTDVAAQFVAVPDLVLQEALNATFEEMQNKFGQDEFGTTACVTTAWIDAENHLRIWNANVGDSAAWLVTINSDTNSSSIIALNKLHSPDPAVNEEEHKRVRLYASKRRNTNLWVVGNAVDNISLTRAIGDNRLEFKDDENVVRGVSHAPEFTRRVQLAVPQEKYFLLTACDGLTESSVLTANDIKTIVVENQRCDLHQIAKELVLKAYGKDDNEKKSHDNISVAVTRVSQSPVSLAVFDGHGGISKPGVGVSFDVGKYFYPTLSKNITAAIKVYDPSSKALEIAIGKKDWAMAVYILITLENTKTLNAKVLKKINRNRSKLTEAFIAQVDAIDADGHQDAIAKKELKNALVKDVITSKNALGIILNTPRYEVFFKFTKHEYNNQKVTGSIFKISEKFPVEMLNIEMEQFSPERLLGLN